MNGGSVNVVQKVLTSQWGGLNRKLIGLLYAVQPTVGSNGKRSWDEDSSKPSVKFAVSNCTLEAQMQYASPFESIGISHIAPLISGAIQSGMLQTAANAVAAYAPSETIAKIAADLGSSDQINALAGASPLTKLNSSLIFNGMQALKWQMTAHFRAWKDPKAEVEGPVNQLMSFALPQRISDEGFVTTLAKNHDFLKALFPSEAPQILGFNFANMQIAPCIIESIGQSLTAPMDADGNRLNVSVQLNMSTLGAIDKNDWSSIVGD